ncbi:MAG: histidine phosphatase family protein [Alphaproteobacteria bacterium]|nr:histidine phosphatase family protein [Alphaproteobacteria bacterium]
MNRLILLRHAVALPRAAGAEDRERALDSQGRIQAESAGDWLAARGFAPDLVLVSPARRTRETWAAAAPRLPTAPVVEDEALYDAMPEDILAAVERESGEARTVLVVAHNPGLQELAQLLLARGRGVGLETVSRGFPTASAAVINLTTPEDPWLEGRFDPAMETPPGPAPRPQATGPGDRA